MLRVCFNIIFALLGGIYFAMYYFFGYNEIFFEFFIKHDGGKELYSFINGIIGGIFFIGIIGLFSALFEKVMNKFFPNVFFTEFFVKIITFSKYIIALQVFTYFAIVPEKFHEILTKIYSIGVIVIFLIFITGLIRSYLKQKVLKNKKLTTEGKTLILFLEKAAIVIIWVIGGITIFDNLGYNISAFIAGAGIGGLAIAFAAQKSIANIFGAITILLNKPFKYNDTVKINGITGKVDSISLTHVRLIEKSGHIVYVPNDSIISSNIENFTNRKNRRTEFTLSLDINTPSAKVDKAIETIKSILQEYQDGGTISSYRVTFEMIGQFSFDIHVLFFSLYNKDFDEYSRQKEEINFKIKGCFDKLGVKMAHNVQELLVRETNTKNVVPLEKPIIPKVKQTTTKSTSSKTVTKK